MDAGLLSKLRSSKLTTQFLVYLSSGTLAKIIPFLILPLVANTLGTEGFGRAANFNVLVQFLAPFMLLKQEDYYKTHYYKLDRETYQHRFSNSIVLSMVIAIIVFAVSPLFAVFVSKYFKISSIWIGGAVLAALASSLFLQRDTILRFDEKVNYFSAFQIGFSIITTALVVVFVLLFELNWEGRVSATILSSAVFIVLTLLYFLRAGYLKFSLKLKEIRKPLRFSLPLMPQAITPLARQATDKLFITNYVGLTANGVYSLALTFTLAFEMVIEALQNAYIPRLYKLLTQKKELENSELGARIKKELFFGIVIIGLMLFIGYFVLRLIVLSFLDDSYKQVLAYLPFILINVFLNSINKAQIQLILFQGKTLKLGYTFILVASTHLGISMLLVGDYGVIGVIIALLTASTLRLILLSRLTIKSTPL